jgi:archaellum biogenesis ATPase FlaH
VKSQTEIEELQFSDDTIERILIKKSCVDSAYAQLFSEVYDKRWIQHPVRGTLLRFILAYYAKTNSAPTQEMLLALLSKKIGTDPTLPTLEEFSAELKQCLDNNLDIQNSDLVKETVFNYIRQRGVYYAIIDNLSQIESRKDVTKTIKAFEKVLNASLDTDYGVDYFADAEKHIEILQSPAERLSTGYRELDYVFNGGLLRNGRCLFVPFGQPGIGKSLFLSNLAVNALMQNKTVVVFTLELAEHIYLQRVDSHITDVEINSIPANGSVVLEKIKKFHAKYPNGNLIIKEYPPSSVSCAHFENFLNKLKVRGVVPDLILVDYLKLVNPKTSFTGMNSYQKLDAVATELRAMSANFNCPVVSPHQLNRDGSNNTDLGMEHVAESFAINHVSDVICALFQGENDKEAGKMNAVILKNRLGGHVGRILNWDIDYKTLRISDGSSTTVADKVLSKDLEELNLLGM